MIFIEPQPIQRENPARMFNHRFNIKKVDIDIPATQVCLLDEKILTQGPDNEGEGGKFKGDIDKLKKYTGDFWPGQFRHDYSSTINGAHYFLSPIFQDSVFGCPAILALLEPNLRYRTKEFYGASWKKEKYNFNVYYQSQSHGVWRIVHGFGLDSGRLFKAYPEHALNLPNTLQVVLGKITHSNHTKNQLEKKDFISFVAPIYKWSFNEYGTFRQHFQDKDAWTKGFVDMSPIQCMKIDLLDETPITIKSFNGTEYVKPEMIRFKNEGYNPQYAKIIAEFITMRKPIGFEKETIYGKLLSSNNSEIEYLFFHNEYGSVWIGNIEMRNQAIHPYLGVIETPIDVTSGLMMPAVAYKEEIPQGYDTLLPLEKKGGWLPYADCSTYLNKIPMIQEFKKYFGV
ncbi:MAG TPA: hypothetical protein VJB63_02815 [Patescibacteria group bacterium]|nr:hypothetical protein [Patescibacteria group bacterium]